MFTRTEHLPSLQALRASDERRIDEELRVVATRQQLAIVRTFADEVERCLVRGGALQTLRDQVMHELAQLGCRSLELAAAMAKRDTDVEEKSGSGGRPPLALVI